MRAVCARVTHAHSPAASSASMSCVGCASPCCYYWRCAFHCWPGTSTTHSCRDLTVTAPAQTAGQSHRPPPPPCILQVPPQFLLQCAAVPGRTEPEQGGAGWPAPQAGCVGLAACQGSQLEATEARWLAGQSAVCLDRLSRRAELVAM
jgi:hypothetical protein